jgi:hypothetical protein
MLALDREEFTRLSGSVPELRARVEAVAEKRREAQAAFR